MILNAFRCYSDDNARPLLLRPVLEYACPVCHTNLNIHLTESIETVQKRALKCIYPGNEYADIVCLIKEPTVSEGKTRYLVQKIFPKNNGNHTPA